MPPKYRGTRPTRPSPWPRRADSYRQDMYDAAGEIITKVDRVRDRPQANIYLTERMLAEIGELAQYIQRLALEAKLLGPPDEDEASLLDNPAMTNLIRDEVTRQLADLGVTPRMIRRME